MSKELNYIGEPMDTGAKTYNQPTYFVPQVDEIYCPEPSVSSSSVTALGFNTTTDVIVKGSFLDQITSITSASQNGTGTLTVNNFSIDSYDQLTINITTDSTVDNHILTLVGNCGEVELTEISVLSITVVTPDVSGTAPELWVKSGGGNNSVLGLGTFEAEDTSGNGWNEHAYFGSVSSATRLDFNMTLDRLSGNSSAYCFIRFNTTNNPSTTGNPRLYIQNSNTLTFYDSSGNQSSLGTVSVNDTVKVSLTNSSAEVFVNGTSVYNDVKTYNLNNIYVTFTAYRTFAASDITLQIFN